MTRTDFLAEHPTLLTGPTALGCWYVIYAYTSLPDWASLAVLLAIGVVLPITYGEYRESRTDD